MKGEEHETLFDSDNGALQLGLPKPVPGMTINCLDEFAMEKRPVYIYGLTEPDGSRVRYVGRTVDPRARYMKHISKARSLFTRCANWLKSLERKSQKPGVILIECCDQDKWQQRECYWIAHFPNLTNIESGGKRDYTVSLETRKKLSKVTPSKKTRMAISKSLRGKPGTFKGKKHTEESKRKMSETRQGRPGTWIGRKHSEESKQKMSVAHLGRKLDRMAVYNLYNTGQYTQEMLSNMYNVTQSTISNIVRHKRRSC